MNKFDNLFFALLAESKFRRIEEDLLDSVKQLAKRYEDRFKYLSPSEIIQSTQSVKLDPNFRHFFRNEQVDRVAPLGEFKFTDLETKQLKIVRVIVAFGGISSSSAHYRDEVEIMTLFHDKIKNFSTRDIEALIIHEMTHGFQQYKDISQEYSDEMERLNKGEGYNDEVYAQEPVEFDSHLTEIGFTIRDLVDELKRNIANSKMPETKRVFESRLEKFLLELKVFIKADAASFLSLKELSLPSYLEQYEYFIESIQNNKRLWKKFKQSLMNLYQELILK